MNATLERLESHTPSKPISHILANYFQKFISYWTQTNLRFLGDLQEEVVDMPVEICMHWNGNASGTLIIRCYDDFLKWFSVSKSYRPLSICTGKEVLNEMIAEYCTYLICNFWQPELLEIRTMSPRPCRPEDWPSETPVAAFGVLVEKHPVEIRFWMD
jgi:hypothetical protein